MTQSQNLTAASPTIETISIGDRTIEMVTHQNGARQYNDASGKFASVTTILSATESERERVCEA